MVHRAVAVLAVFLSLGCARAEQAKMPGEWKELTRSGITVFYQEDTKDLAPQILDLAEKKLRDKSAAADVSGLDRLVRNKDKVLELIASQLGLQKPGEEVDKIFESLVRGARQMELMLPDPHRLRLWRKETLKRLLIAGEKIPGFTYDKAEDTVTLEWKAQAGKEQIAPPDTCMPIVIKDDSERTPVEQAADMLDSCIEMAGEMIRHAGPGILCHELAEGAIVETVGVQGPFRRWFCEGAATWVAERCVERFVGNSAAEAFRKRNASSAKAAAEEVDLIAWRATEWSDEMPEPAGGDLKGSYYAFAELEVRELVKRHGQNTVPEICKAIRESGSHDDDGMYAAIKKVTGEDMKEVLGKYGEACKDEFRGIAVNEIEAGECEWDKEGRWRIAKPGEGSSGKAYRKDGVAFRLNCAILDRPAKLRVDLVGPAGDEAAPAATHSAAVTSEDPTKYFAVLGHDGRDLTPGPYRVLIYINDKLLKTIDVQVTGK